MKFIADYRKLTVLRFVQSIEAMRSILVCLHHEVTSGQFALGAQAASVANERTSLSGHGLVVQDATYSAVSNGNGAEAGEKLLVRGRQSNAKLAFKLSNGLSTSRARGP
jgi:hypothetical protein